MRFTEHELTIAVTAAAKTVAGAKGRRRADADAVWESMSKLDRYHHLEAVGGQVLPVLLALPDVEVPAGTRPTFTDAQVLAAVEETLGEGGGPAASQGHGRRAGHVGQGGARPAAHPSGPRRPDRSGLALRRARGRAGVAGSPP